MASVYRHGRRWRASVVLPTGHRTTRVFEFKSDADAWARQIESDADRGKWTDPTAGRQLFSSYAAEWIEAQRWRPSTREQADSHLRRWILPAFGHLPIGSITNTQVRAFVTHLDEHLSPNTVESVYRRVVAVFEGAVADRVIAINPATARKIELPKAPPREATQLVNLNVDDVTRLAGVVSPWMTAFVWCGAMSGLRPGEIAGLAIEAIDWEESALKVDRQLSTVRGGPRLAPPKTRASYRTVPVPDRLLQILREHSSAFPPVEVPDPLSPGTSRSLIFSNRDGRPHRRNGLSDAWRRGAQQAALKPEADGWHQLRHFYVSALIDAGASVKTVQARMGHSSAQETLQTYASLWPTADDSTRAAISAVFESNV